MAGKTLVAACQSSTTDGVASGNTRFCTFGDAESAFGSTTDAENQFPMQRVGKWTNLGCHNYASSGGFTGSLSINGTAGNLSTAPGSGPSNAQDTTHTDSTNVNDLVDFKMVTSGSGNSDATFAASFNQNGSGQGKPYAPNGYGTGNQTIVLNTTTFWALYGAGHQNATETLVQYKSAQATLSAMFAYFSTFTLNANITLVSRVNTTTKNQTITISGTGRTQDSTHSDAVNNNDLIDVQQSNTAASGTNTFMRTLGIWALYLKQAAIPFGGNSNNNFSLNTTSSFAPSCGQINPGGVTTEATAQNYAADAFTWKLLQLVTSAFTSGSTAITSRVASGAGAQSITVNAAGTFQDATHSDSVTASSIIDYSVNGTAVANAQMLLAQLVDPNAVDPGGLLTMGAGQ